jgi:cytochrome c-type biogenesis protein CcmH
VIAFSAIAVVLLLLALAIVLRPLLKRATSAVVVRSQSNLEIHRDQFVELQRDLASGSLSPDRYEQAKAELEKRVLDEGATPADARQAVTPGKTAPIVVGVLIPLAAVLLYLYLGNPQGLVAPDQSPAITPEHFQDMTAKLAARMEQTPDDAQGWAMLGRAYRTLERFAPANDAFAKAVKLKPDDADLLADYAESLGLAAGRSLAGEPTRLLDRALKLDPHNTKVLALSGSAAYERKDYAAAIRDWEAILKQPGISGELAQALQKAIDESKTLLSGKAAFVAITGKERVRGEVSLDASLKAKVQPDDTVFVFARAAKGPRMPLAIARTRVRELPYRFSFDDSSAMMPDMKLSKFSEVVIGARVSRSGSATPAAGDLEGFSGGVKPGQTGIRVNIDREIGQP